MAAVEEKSEGGKDAAAARSVLQSVEGAEMGAVHSNRSVTAMIKSSRDKQQADQLENQGSRVLNHVSNNSNVFIEHGGYGWLEIFH